MLLFFRIFGIKTRVFGCFLGMPLRGAPLRGALGRAPPPFCKAEVLKKFSGKSVPENYTLFFDKKHVFGYKNKIHNIKIITASQELFFLLKIVIYLQYLFLTF